MGNFVQESRYSFKPSKICKNVGPGGLARRAGPRQERDSRVHTVLCRICQECIKFALRLKTWRPDRDRIPRDLNPRVLFSGSCAGCVMIVIGLKLSITRQRKNLTGLVECVVTPNGVAV
jgi:hypothetical protein